MTPPGLSDRAIMTKTMVSGYLSCIGLRHFQCR
jgi:hypothetical protein